jgi:ribonuclease R
LPAPVGRARAAAAEGQESKPPRRRKAKDAANGGARGALPVSAQEARGTPAEPPAASFSASDESEADIVFVPPTRRGRGNRGSKGANNATRQDQAPSAEAKKSAAKKAASKNSAPRKSAAKAPERQAAEAVSKTSRKKK